MTTQKPTISGQTQSGFKYVLKKKDLNNFELFEALSELQDNPLLLPKVVLLLLGCEQKKMLYNHVREKDGTVPIEKIEKEITDIFKQVKEIKN